VFTVSKPSAKLIKHDKNFISRWNKIHGNSSTYLASNFTASWKLVSSRSLLTTPFSKRDRKTDEEKNKKEIKKEKRKVGKIVSCVYGCVTNNNGFWIG
jgi:hypothetical protein